MTSAAKSPYAGYRFPGEVISHAVWLYFRFPLSLRMVEEMLAARGIDVSHETVRQWARRFGQAFANQIRRRLPCPGDKWHLDEVCLMIRGTKHWLWRAVGQDGVVLDVLVQSRRDKQAALWSKCTNLTVAGREAFRQSEQSESPARHLELRQRGARLADGSASGSPSSVCGRGDRLHPITLRPCRWIA